MYQLDLAQIKSGSALLAACIAVFWGSQVRAQQPGSCDSALGSGSCLPWGNTVISQIDGEITSLSADGSVLAGTTISQSQAWRFKQGIGVSLLTIDGATSVIPGFEAQSISANGSIVVGTVTFPSGDKRAFRWDVEGGVHTLLPEGPAPEALRIRGAGSPPGTWTIIPEKPIISDLGDVVVGTGRAIRTVGGLPDVVVEDWPFHWSVAEGATDDSPAAPFDYQVFVQGFSGDGSTILARTDGGPGLVPHTVRIRNGIGEEVNPNVGRPTTSTYDGQVIWGTLSASPFNPFRWRAINGVSTTIPVARFVSRSLSDDGAISTGARRDFPVAFTDTPWVYDLSPGSPLVSSSLKDYLENLVFGYGFSSNEDHLIPTNFIRYALAARDGRTLSVVGSKRVSRIPALQFVGLGDSYSSGEGVPLTGSFDNPGPFQNGTDVEDFNECHRSLRAYSRLVRPRSSWRTFEHFTIDGGEIPGWDFRFVACSGATTANVLAVGQWNELPQISNVDNQTDVITLTIGGNDAWFFRIGIYCSALQECQDSPGVLPGETFRTSVLTHIRTTVRQRLENVYSSLKTTSPNATIIVVGYPMLFPVDSDECGDFLVNSAFSPLERGFINDATRRLNETIASAAREVGVHHLDITKSFAGHDACAGANAWILGAERPLRYSFHPNQAGQARMAREVNLFLERQGIASEFGFNATGMPLNPAPSGS